MERLGLVFVAFCYLPGGKESLSSEAMGFSSRHKRHLA